MKQICKQTALTVAIVSFLMSSAVAGNIFKDAWGLVTAIEIAARVDAALASIGDRISKLEAAQAALGNGRILAIAQIKERNLYFASPGVSFDPGSGVFSFPNPKGLGFVPVISDSDEKPYITGTHWIKSILAPDKFIVWSKALDTGGADRTWYPHDFTVVVIGFEATKRP